MNSESLSDHGINLPTGSSGEVRVTCPQCSAKRTKSEDKCLAVNVDEGTWHCHHCGWRGGLKKQRNWLAPEKKKVFKAPDYKNEGSAPPELIRWFNRRGISTATVERASITLKDGWIKIPYFRGVDVVNIKYRHIEEKKFRQEKGAEKIVYGEHLCGSDRTALVWVEGEVDALACFEAGIPCTVSVPDGAPMPNTKSYTTKFSYLEACSGFVSEFDTHIIATDADGPGDKLGDELARRLGVEKCKKVEWPEGCKDANDVLMKHDAVRLRECIFSANRFPVEGVFEVKQILPSVVKLYDEGYRKGYSTGFVSLDQNYSVRAGEFTIVTGMPSSGKSEWMDAVMINLAERDGWRFAVFSPENQPLAEHWKKLAEKYIGKAFHLGHAQRMDEAELGKAALWLQDHFYFILPPDDQLGIDMIIEKAKVCLYRYGINGLLIDPWNELDTSRPSGMSETEYISYCLSKLRKFARMANIHLWLVAHPTKMQKDKISGEYLVPKAYDIAGSAHFRNKADNCISVHRPDYTKHEVEIHVQKIRFKEVGRMGMVTLNYDYATGRFEAQTGKWQ